MKPDSVQKLNNQNATESISNFWFALFAVVSVNTIMPVIGRAISSFLTTYFLLVMVILVWIFFLLQKIDNWLYCLLPMLLISVIQSLSEYIRGDGLVFVLYRFLLYGAPLIIALCFQRVDHQQQKNMFLVLMAAICITTVTSIIGFSSNPGAARYLATVADASDAKNVRYEWLNMGGFIFTYMLVTIYPAVICYAKEKNWDLWRKLVLMAGLLIYFISAEYTTALIMFFIISVLWLMPKNFSTSKMIAIFIVLILLFLLLKGPLADLLYDLAKQTDSENFHDRFLYMADSLSGVENESDVGLREELLMKSWTGFLEHPIIGNWSIGNRSGGHSFTLDFLCQYGLVGLWLLVASYKRIYEVFYIKFKDSEYIGYIVATFMTAIILSTVNTGSHWFELVLVVPLIFEMIKEKDEKEKEQTDEGIVDNEHTYRTIRS